MENVKNFLAEARALVDQELDRLTSATSPRAGRSLRLGEAVRWSLLGGGKRFRPALMMAVGRAFGADVARLVGTAAAVEMLHTYSLIHDDLPAMDDDDLRRGRATCHRQFDEATAILAGDALQAAAFKVIASDETLGAELRIELVSELAAAADAMVNGQQLDLEAEGRQLTLQQIEEIHRGKTGALVSFSAKAGAMIAGAGRREIECIHRYGETLGLLFQVTDDILDVTRTSEQLGKTAGKDVSVAKATYPSILGVDGARDLATSLCAEAVASVSSMGVDDEILRAIPRLILERGS
ncbi:MAG: polyprenyl synthetase family protein [Pyrinomonadaceae bacterium]